MKLAIISDIHDNLPNLKKCLAWCQENQIAKIICPGDLTNRSTLSYLAHNFLGEIFMVQGNGELYEEKDLKKFPNIKHYGPIGYINIDGLNIGFCHEPIKINKLIADSTTKPDFIFYGHTHKPWQEERDSIPVINPGNLAGTNYAATFATLDTSTKELQLKILTEL